MSKWDELVDAIIAFGKSIIKTPIFWALLILIFIIFFTLYNLPRDTKRMRRSVIGLIDYAGKVLMGFVGDILTAIESITGFVDIIRVVLKGKLTEGVQFLLGNYAIIALSVASFGTTFNGMSQIMPWYMAALVTFGIQVGILSMSSKIALEWNKRRKQKAKFLRETDYSIGKKLLPKDAYEERKVVAFTDSGEVEKFAWAKRDNEKQVEEQRWHSPKKKSKLRTTGLFVKYFVLLTFSMCASIYFSYVYFFNELILPNIPMETYLVTLSTVTEETNNYSYMLNDMGGVFVENLQELNQNIRNKVDMGKISLAETQIETLEHDIEELDTEIEALQTQINELTALRAEADADNREVDAGIYDAQVDALNSQRRDMERDRDKKQRDLDNQKQDNNGDTEYLDNRSAVDALNLSSRLFLSLQCFL